MVEHLPELHGDVSHVGGPCCCISGGEPAWAPGACSGWHSSGHGPQQLAGWVAAAAAAALLQGSTLVPSICHTRLHRAPESQLRLSCAHAGFDAAVAAQLAQDTQLSFRPADNKFAAIAAHDALVAAHGALNVAATALYKV